MTASKRNILKAGILIALALTAGYAGAALRGHPDPTGLHATVRATRFELVDSSGRAIAILAANPASPGGGDAGAALVLTDPRGVRRCELGISRGNSAPFLRLYGGDGAERVGVLLGYHDDPVLTLRDAQRIRTILGARHGDTPGPSEDQWGLSLYGRKEGADASIGFYRWADDTYQAAVTIRDGAGRKWEAIAGGPLRPIPLSKGR
jgi:hypothetical protein